MYKQKIYFFNKWQISNSKQTYKRRCLTKKKIFHYYECNKNDLNNVIISAKKGLLFNKNKNFKKRSLYLKKISNLINKNKKKLAELESLETGKRFQSSLNEINYSSKLWLSASKLIKSGIDYKINNEKNVKTKVFHEPVGIVALIIPWNFPFIVLSERLPFILAAGNSVIIKPSEFASQSIIKLLKLIDKINLPEGTLNLVTGSKKIGSLLVENKDVNMVSFTGSTHVGKKIMKKCSNSIKRLSLELGGKNSMILLGQACVGISKAFVPKDIIKIFMRKFIDKLQKIKNFKNSYGPISTDKQYESIKNLILKNKKYDKYMIFGKFKKNSKKFINPIVYLNLPEACEINHKEIFGPILSVLEFDSYENAISMINKTKYGLSSIILSKDKNLAEKIARRIDTGRIWINQSITKNYVNVPIGGFKESGFGRECGIEGIKNYTELKSIIINEKN